MSQFRMTFEGDPNVLNGDPSKLRSLCRKEVDCFDRYLQKVDPNFRDGLSRFERLVIEGYLYQKVKGHIDESDEANHLPMEGKDG